MKNTRWKDFLKAAPLLALLLFVVNPEYRAFLFFLDFIGFDLFAALLVLQLRLTFNRASLQWMCVTVYRFLCSASRIPCWTPSRKGLMARPSLLLHAIPYDSIAVSLFVLSLPVFCAQLLQ